MRIYLRGDEHKGTQKQQEDSKAIPAGLPGDDKPRVLGEVSGDGR